MEVFKTQVDGKSIKVGEQAAEDRGIGPDLSPSRKEFLLLTLLLTMVLTHPPV